MTISFIRIRAMVIPPITAIQQDEIERQYRDMSKFHDRAMAIKERRCAVEYGRTLDGDG